MILEDNSSSSSFLDSAKPPNGVPLSSALPTTSLLISMQTFSLPYHLQTCLLLNPRLKLTMFSPQPSSSTPTSVTTMKVYIVIPVIDIPISKLQTQSLPFQSTQIPVLLPRSQSLPSPSLPTTSLGSFRKPLTIKIPPNPLRSSVST